jgi:hypothetical protein
VFPHHRHADERPIPQIRGDGMIAGDCPQRGDKRLPRVYP